MSLTPEDKERIKVAAQYSLTSAAQKEILWLAFSEGGVPPTEITDAIHKLVVALIKENREMI